MALVLQQLRQTFAALETAGAVDDAAPPDAVAVGLGIDVSSLPSPSPTSEDDAMGSAARRDTLMSEYVELQRLLAQAAAALERCAAVDESPCHCKAHILPSFVADAVRRLSERNGALRTTGDATTTSRLSWKL